MTRRSGQFGKDVATALLVLVVVLTLAPLPALAEGVSSEPVIEVVEEPIEELAADPESIQEDVLGPQANQTIALGTATKLKAGATYRLELPSDGFLTMTSDSADASVHLRTLENPDPSAGGVTLQPEDADIFPLDFFDQAWWNQRRGWFNRVGFQKGVVYATAGTDCTVRISLEEDEHGEYDAQARPLALSTPDATHRYVGTLYKDKGLSNACDRFTFTLDKRTKVQLSFGVSEARPNLSGAAPTVKAYLVPGLVETADDVANAPKGAVSTAVAKLSADQYETSPNGRLFGYSSTLQDVGGKVVTLKPGTHTVLVSTTSTGTYYALTVEDMGTITAIFPDVPQDHWAAGVISRAIDLGIMSGYKNGLFGIDDSITRGQVAVTLWNMAGKPAAGAGAKSFSDVKDSAYYYEAVRWASGVGVVSGYGKTGTFGPTDYVTREQLAVMLANYAKKVKGIRVSGSAADFKAMEDASEVSAYATSSVGWCFKRGVLTGAGGKVLPQGRATRAQAAKMLVKVYDM